MDIVTSTVSQSKKISRTCRLIFEEPEQKPLFSTLQNLCKKLFAKDWCFQCQVKDFVPSFNMGRHTINSNSFGLLTLTLYLSSDDFFIGNLKTGSEREWSFLWFESARRSHYFFWSNGELVTKTIITCNCVVKSRLYDNLVFT